MATFTKPKTIAEAEAAEVVIASLYLDRVEAARAVMTGPEAQAFEAKVAELLFDGLPNGTSAAVNMPSVAKWFVDVRTGLDADFARLDALVNPPPAPSAPEEPQAPADPEA
ncbi:MAG: hypothetical protein P0Y52_07965 [Candidatus Brevundimonas phytovorans]|nr:hypothetical protein [Brevundimonas sp.]WEK56494.1 MAG: hypothetical protein P0Y52_07965 [Brevundimonas sp.]